MNPKIKKIFTNTRVIILLVFLVLSLVAMHPGIGVEGVAIRSVAKNSSAELAGISSPKAGDQPMSREVITYFNNEKIIDADQYYSLIQDVPSKGIFVLRNSKGKSYEITVKEDVEEIELNETELKTFEEIILVNKTINGTVVEVEETVNVTKRVPKIERLVLGPEDIGLRVYDAPTTNIRKGLDLSGGTRVVLQPEEKTSDENMTIILSNIKERVNNFGLSDVTIRSAGDLSGNQYIVIEVPEANEEEVKDLLSKQGKFEAKIGNETVFVGGVDIKNICRTAECAGIDPNYGCGTIGTDLWGCSFYFSVTVSPDSAQKHADITSGLEVMPPSDGKSKRYLSKTLDLYLDDALTTQLQISEGLKGSTETTFQIQGQGTGGTREEAIYNSLQEMNQLRTILITGSLPVKLKITKADTISPVLGKEFVSNALLVGALSILAVVVMVFLRYRKLQVSIPMLFTSISEVVLLLGFAALSHWSIDLSAIAGIIIAVGTGVDHQIVITDETLKKQSERYTSWKDKIKGAFFIIIAAYFTTLAALFPLLFAGAGLLRGFAITTIAGVTFGVLITRPAYGAIIEILLKE